MLELRSALAAASPFRGESLVIAERPDFTYTQYAGLTADAGRKLSALVGAIPTDAMRAHESAGRTVFRTGPDQIQVAGPVADDMPDRLRGLCAVTELTHGRTRIAIDGGRARDVLSKLSFLDFHADEFGDGRFALTGMHHTPVLIHCTGAERFDIYAMRSFALDVWEVLTDAAREFG